MNSVWLKHRTLQRNWPSVRTEIPVIDSLNDLIDIERLIHRRNP